MHRKQVLWLHKSQNLRTLPVSTVQIPLDYLHCTEYIFCFPPTNWSCTNLSDIWASKKYLIFFFSGPETVALRPWVHPAICQNLNPGCLIHDHVSFTLCLSTDTLNTEFWEADSELHSLGLFICVHIPNGDYVLICSELVSLFRYFWDLESAILDSLGRETWTWPSACFLWPLAFAVLCWSFLRPVSISAAGRTLWLFSSFAPCFCKNCDLIVIYTGHR